MFQQLRFNSAFIVYESCYLNNTSYLLKQTFCLKLYVKSDMGYVSFQTKISKETCLESTREMLIIDYFKKVRAI